MTSIAKLKEETNRVVKSAWASLGMPLDSNMIEEKSDGIVDVEALIIATLLVMDEGRLATDLPAWINRFSSLINFQKLKTIFIGLPKNYRALVITRLNHVYFTATSKAFRNVFALKTDAVGALDKIVELRTRRVNMIENVARVSLMIKNRLIYGTGFRADLITLTHIEKIGMKGTELAELMCAANSTVSRILNDLKASRFLNIDGERTESFESYPGMFMSVLSVMNLCEMMDAAQFTLKELKQGTVENLNFKHDVFGREVSEKLF